MKLMIVFVLLITFGSALAGMLSRLKTVLLMLSCSSLLLASLSAQAAAVTDPFLLYLYWMAVVRLRRSLNY